MSTRVVGALLAVALLLLLAVPVVARRTEQAVPAGAATVIIVTPNNEQIRMEFAEGFARWHREKFGAPAQVIWNMPGGATEIRRMLEASTTASLRDGSAPGGSADLLFGGGSYDFEQLTKPIKVEVNGEVRSTTVLIPIDFPQEWLNAVYGENSIAGRTLYDPDRVWFGTALSAFGIVYNAEMLQRMGVAYPTEWSALADPRLQDSVSLVNPAQSGSSASAMETILLREGWQRGWAILRRAAANARSIAAGGPRTPMDVSQGDAAEGLCIDFYGRYQQQAVADGGSPGRVGYVDPVGKTAIDPDPIAMLRGAPHPETARRFIEFVLSPEGQRLWQYPAGSPDGPRQYSLRRLPINRAVYANDMPRFVDKVDPWKLARVISNPNPHVRSFVVPIFVAMSMENRSLLRTAWALIAAHPEYPRDGRMLLASDATDPTLRAMLTAFDAMPVVPGPNGTTFDLADESALAQVREGWMRGKWKDAGLWGANDVPTDVFRRILSDGFKANLQRVIAISRSSAP